MGRSPTNRGTAILERGRYGGVKAFQGVPGIPPSALSLDGPRIDIAVRTDMALPPPAERLGRSRHQRRFPLSPGKEKRS
jgi:hypothetical protein